MGVDRSIVPLPLGVTTAHVVRPRRKVPRPGLIADEYRLPGVHADNPISKN
jgi:hypothetical protein